MPIAVIIHNPVLKQVYAQLKADNGRILGHTEYYTRVHNVKKILYKYFPSFKIVHEGKGIKDAIDSEE